MIDVANEPDGLRTLRLAAASDRHAPYCNDACRSAEHHLVADDGQGGYHLHHDDQSPYCGAPACVMEAPDDQPRED